MTSVESVDKAEHTARSVAPVVSVSAGPFCATEARDASIDVFVARSTPASPHARPHQARFAAPNGPMPTECSPLLPTLAGKASWTSGERYGEYGALAGASTFAAAYCIVSSAWLTHSETISATGASDRVPDLVAMMVLGAYFGCLVGCAIGIVTDAWRAADRSKESMA